MISTAKGTATVFDALYGAIEFSAEIARLMQLPIVQRLREIRLSNIDSLSTPGVANISRFEHALGTCYVASKVGFANGLSKHDRTALAAAALLHDSAIPPYGHLMEEAAQYLGADLDHEARWARIFAKRSEQLGGLELQLFMGRESGVTNWANSVFGGEAGSRLESILDAIRGRGPFGHCVCGEIDLDNLDNVVRAAYHMGIPCERSLPVRIASGMISSKPGCITFSRKALPYIEEWLALRRDVYTHFMLSHDDFAGKIMLIAATVAAFEKGILREEDWILTDRDFLNRLLGCEAADVKSPVTEWACGELWPLSDLLWFSGNAPTYKHVNDFSTHLSVELERPCFAYRIKDKRSRLIKLSIESEATVTLGTKPTEWLLGVASRKRKPFNRSERDAIARFASEFFGSKHVGKVSLDDVSASDEQQTALELI